MILALDLNDWFRIATTPADAAPPQGSSEPTADYAE
jgi:hypothetical protein